MTTRNWVRRLLARISRSGHKAGTLVSGQRERVGSAQSRVKIDALKQTALRGMEPLLTNGAGI